jgi:phosphatidate cytidylyltransferase
MPTMVLVRIQSFLFFLWLIASSTRLADASSDPAATTSAGFAQPAQFQQVDPTGAAVEADVLGGASPPTGEAPAPPSLDQTVANANDSSSGKGSAIGDTPLHAASAAQPGQAATSPVAATTTTSSLVRWRLPRFREVKVHPRFANLVDRTAPAVLLLAALLAVAHKGGELGLRYLLVVLSPGLYSEAVSVATSASSSSASSGANLAASLNRWGWFVAYSLIVTLPSVAPAAVKGEHLRYAGYATSLLCWMGWILRLNANKKDQQKEIQSSTDQGAARFFRAAWSEVAAYHVAALVALVPIHSLLSVLRAGRMDWALYACLLVICNDTFAYLVGHFVGKRSLLPVISPKKTIEGWAGGFVLTTLASPLLWRRLFDRPYAVHSLHVALFGSIVAPFGGYLASTAKRAFGTKDFGSLLGSHGGLIDRLDCQLITAPYLYLFLAAIGEL